MEVGADALIRVLIPAYMQPSAPVLGRVVHSLHGTSMGTSWCVRFAAHPDMALDRVRQLVEEALNTVDSQMSTWRADSNLSQFNSAQAGEWVTFPAACFEVLSCALALAEQSGGAFDPATGALVNLWGFGPGDGFRQSFHRAPSADEIDAVLPQCGWQKIVFDQATQAVKQAGGVMLDFSGIAKGYAVDLVAHKLDAAGFADYLIEVGGELRGAGVKPNGHPWWVDLEMPPEDAVSGMPATTQLPTSRLALHGVSVATSGNYRRYFRDGAHHFAHTLDPRTGQPVEQDLVSVSVVHAECMVADALATALTVLGAEAGLAYANQHDIAASFLSATTNGWSQVDSQTFLSLLE